MPAPITVKLRCASWRQLASIHRRDLTRSALFLKSSQPPPLGTRIRVNLTLPSETLIILSGTVAEHVPAGGMAGRGPGIDIALDAIPQTAMWLIETALASAGADRSDAPTARNPVAQEQARLRSAQPAASGAEGSRESSPAVEDGATVVTAEDDLVDALRRELDSMRKLNPFQVLGIEYDTADAPVRAAFGELTKRYHPDRFARYQSREARDLASEIFILIRDAYRRVVDQPSRDRLLRALHQGPRRRGPTTAKRPSAAAPPAPAAPPSSAKAAPVEVASRIAAASEQVDDLRSLRIDDAPRPSAADDLERAQSLLEEDRFDEALRLYAVANRRSPSDRRARAGMELAEGLKALAQRDRMEAAQRFEAVLELDPSNERAARELAGMRRQATNERKGLLSRLLGQAEGGS